jgi:hypothetical protein
VGRVNVEPSPESQPNIVGLHPSTAAERTSDLRPSALRQATKGPLEHWWEVGLHPDKLAGPEWRLEPYPFHDVVPTLASAVPYHEPIQLEHMAEPEPFPRWPFILESILREA